MTQASNGNGDQRPSSARRKGLQEADAGSGSVPSVSNFFPIERYYDAADKVRLRRIRLFLLSIKIILHPSSLQCMVSDLYMRFLLS
jgi:hypothetical protein